MVSGKAHHSTAAETEAEKWVRTASWQEVIEVLSKAREYFLHMASKQEDSQMTEMIHGTAGMIKTIEDHAAVQLNRMYTG